MQVGFSLALDFSSAQYLVPHSLGVDTTERNKRGSSTTSVTTHCDFEAEAATATAQRDQRRLEPLERAACLQRRQPLLARQMARRGERAELCVSAKS